MDSRKRKLLQAHQKEIVQDLDSTYIIDDLYTNHVISTDEFDRIYNITDRADRTRFLLSVIQSGGDRAFEVFVDSLAKDYGWLYEKLNANSMKDSPLSESFEDSLSRGDVPRLPEYYVRRTKLENDVTAKLSELSRHHILALHGMSGCGKSSAAVGALRHRSRSVLERCAGVVFWLNMANVKTEDDVIAKQIKLYRKTSQYRKHEGTFMNSTISMSSIGSNTDSQSLASNDWCWQELRDVLKTTFQDDNLKEALLVLDEVNEKKSVEALDIGCKILITTRDTDVVASLQPQIIEVSNSLEERESLQLFASCLGVTETQVPRRAARLHALCRGSPFHVALLAAQLAEHRERLLHDHKRWDYYIAKLSKKDIRSFLRLGPDQCDPMKPIEMCINSLESHIRQLFKMLAVLPDNVKVSAKVLSVLWGKHINEVESIMKKLRSKSLINECYVPEQRNYIYEIHDLIMNYLRSELTVEQNNKLHIDFLKNYGYDILDNLPVELPDDGYIPFYIGYHLDRSNKPNKNLFFNRLYLDLKFLGNKVRLTGPADVIMDLQKYGNAICRDKMDEELYRAVSEYLSTHGTDLYRYPRTDLVQSVLQYTAEGALYRQAHQLAREGSARSQLYFDFLHEPNVDDAVKPINIDVKQTITSVCFLYDYALVGTKSGVIKIFHIYTNKLKRELSNSSHPIKCVTACPMNPLRVAALNTIGELQLWYLDDPDPDLSDHTIDEENTENEKVGSEHEENEYENNYTDSYITIKPKMGPFVNVGWANNEETLLTHTLKMIILYRPDGVPSKVLDKFDRDIEIVCCLFNNDDTSVIVGYSVNNSYYVDVIQLRTQDKLMTFKETGPILNILCIPGTVDRIMLIKEKDVSEYEWKSTHSYPVNNYNTYKSEKIISNKEVKENVKFVSGAVNKAGTLLYVATDDSRIVCVDLKTNAYFYLDNRRGNVVTMAVSEMSADEFEPGSDVLLSGTGTVEHSVKVWHFDAAYLSQATQKHRRVRLTARFDVSFASTPSPRGTDTPPADTHSAAASPRRHQSFVTTQGVAEKRCAKKSLSLDRHALKPLNLKSISNGDDNSHPLLAVVDDKNSIQVMRGRKVLTEITVRPGDEITAVRISPCNQHVMYGLQCGTLKRFTLRTKETKNIMEIYSRIQYLKYVTPNLLVVSGKNHRMMAYRFNYEGEWKLHVLQKGMCNLGSQELLNDIQGNKIKNGNSGSMSRSDSDASINSKERLFPSTDGKGRLNKGSSLVECFWLEGIGMLSVESTATIKLWDQEMNLITVLIGRQTDVYINCAAFQRNILVICDDYGKFQTFEIKEDTPHATSLHTIQEYKLNNKIVSCDLTRDGNILAMGLDSGFIVVWNVPGKSQLSLLKHHKSQVQACVFSPPSPAAGDPPLVLVTMASEIVWWNVSYLIKQRATSKHFRSRGRNVLTPLMSPVESRTELTAAMDSLNFNHVNNYFFGNGYSNMSDSWEGLWTGKTFKDGSKKKEILACIKLSGMNAKKLCVDEKFSCFVTVDNPGHIHIMNVMKASRSGS